MSLRKKSRTPSNSNSESKTTTHGISTNGSLSIREPEPSDLSPTEEELSLELKVVDSRTLTQPSLEFTETTPTRRLLSMKENSETSETTPNNA